MIKNTKDIKKNMHDHTTNPLTLFKKCILYVCLIKHFVCMFQVLTKALWCITSHHITIDEAASRSADVKPVPDLFSSFSGYNDFKRKKIKAGQLSQVELESHAGALFGLLNKPYMKLSFFSNVVTDIQLLSDCLSSYAEHLKTKLGETKNNASLDFPVRAIDDHATVQSKEKTLVLDPRYTIIDDAVRMAGIGNPVIFDEDLHLTSPFTSPVQRFRFFDNIRLSVDIDMIKFHPGGGLITTVCLCQVREKRTNDDMLTQGAQLLAKMRPHLKECHTRQMKKTFKKKINNIAKIQPSILEYLYSELSFDRSAAENPIVRQRLELICGGAEGLLADMRHLNPGRPTGQFDTFFQKMIGIIEEKTAADDRRHGEAHLSEWLSIRDLVEQTTALCPPETPIPSKELVRLQFTPTNPYTHAALSFTSKLGVQRKIQRRQLRANHPDGHYCNALFKYLKQRKCELGDSAMMVCSDDKAKVKVGEPDKPISTGVRGRESIASVASTLTALDHDMGKASITPSVILQVSKEVKSVDESFVRGKVGVTLNDSVFEGSNPFRHAAMLVKFLERGEIPNILLKYSDGGTDQRNTLESVRCATICLFKELNLDMVIASRCAPGHSFMNPVERVMSVLNIGLQNCALEREKMEDEKEALVKRCSSASEVRKLAVKSPEIETNWKDSIRPVKEVIAQRFQRLKLKDDPITVINTVTSEEEDMLKRHLKALFPSMDLEKLQKAHTDKNAEYQLWKQKHCFETNYTFQVRKCNSEECCPPKLLPDEELYWQPEPVLDHSGNHFKPFELLKGTEPTEADRPSLQSKVKRVPAATTSKQTEPTEPDTAPTPGDNICIPQTIQNAQATATCIDCRKPRVIFSNKVLSQRQKVLLATVLSEFEYTCGSHIFPPHSEPITKSIQVKTNITCATPIELSYYGDKHLGKKDLCAYCASEGGHIDSDMKKKFQRVLPICSTCANTKKPICMRPFGKSK